VTITDSPTETPPVDEAQALFPEAKQRRRRRWLIVGTGIFGLLVVVGIVVGLLVTQGGSGGSSRPQTNPAPTPPAVGAANAVFTIRPVLCYAPPYSVAPGEAPATGPLPTCSASTALTASNLQVEVSNSSVNGYTVNGNINADPQFASYPSTTPSSTTQGRDVILPGSPAIGPNRYVLGPVGLNRSAIARARVTENNGQWAVDLILTPRGSAQWNAFAIRTFHAISAVVINGHVVSAPIMQPTQSVPTSFQGQIQISGGFNRYQARAIAADL
jgi:hypothetical protein